MTRTITLNLTKTITGTITIQDDEGQAGEVPGNIISNGAFGTDLSSWTLPNGAGSAVWVDGKAVNNNGDDNIQQTVVPLTVGVDYVLSIDVEVPDGGAIRPNLVLGGVNLAIPDIGGYTTSGSKTFSFTASDAFDTVRIDFLGEAAGSYTVDNVTLLPA